MKYQKKPLSEVLRSGNTVFSFKDISLIWRETKRENAISAINYYVKTGDLYRIRRGIYAKDKDYNRYELASKVFSPSYISFETVLASGGIIFQYYGQIFVASYLTREIKADDQIFSYRKIKNTILTNHAGIINKGNYTLASTERAFLDVVYLNKDYYFDNLSGLDWEKVFEILPIYENKRMEKLVKIYYKEFKNNIS